jgi:predicted PurR-regulated permease PerM
MNQADQNAPAKQSFMHSRQFRTWMLVASGVGFVVLAALLRNVTTPILISLVIAYILDPVVLRLERLGLRRLLAVGLVYITFLGILALVFALTAPRLYREASKLPGYVGRIARQAQVSMVAPAGVGPSMAPAAGQPPEAQAATQEPDGVEPADEQPESQPAGPAPSAQARRETQPEPTLVQTVTNMVRQGLASIAASALSSSGNVVARVVIIVQGVIGALVQVILVLVYTFFFLLGLHPFYERVKRYLPGRHRKEILRAFKRLDEAYSSFYRGRLIIAASVGVLTTLGLWGAGLPFWLLIGMTVGVLSIVPIVGILVGLVLAVTVAAFAAGWPLVIGVLAVFAALQLIEQVLTPLVLSHQVRLHPVTIVIGLLVGAEAFGVFGAIIAVPLVSTAKVMFEEFLFPTLKELADEPSEE